MSEPTVIITGGEGFVGRYLRRELASTWSDSRVVSWDLPQIDLVQSESYMAELEQLQPDWIVHLAAISSVPESLEDPQAAFQVNVQATEQLLTAAQKVSEKTRFLITSTADIYGQGSSTPLSELPLTQAHPANPYAESKLAMEKVIEKDFLDRVIRTRPFPHIGPEQRVGFVSADFASQIAAIEKGKQEPVIRVGNLEAERDFSDVRDVVRAYRLLMEKGELGEVYHVASGVSTSIEELLHMLLGMSTVEIEIAQDAARMRPSDIAVLVGDASKLRRVCGWKPEIPLRQSLQDVLAWWREQPA